MRFLSCKILQCPFTCFCKPSSHIYTTDPLKLEDAAPNQLSSETADLKGESFEEKNEQQEGNCIKSNIKRPVVMEAKEVPTKKQVQWIDFLGKELVEIREFESSDVEDMENEGIMQRGCICV